MNRGVFAAASGMGVQLARMDAISNNLANINVPGFKGSQVTAASFPDLVLLGSKGRVLGRTCQGAAVTGVHTDFSSGPLRQTGVSTHLAISGDGFFVVRDPSGALSGPLYTRNGDFELDREGYLVTSTGYRVQGENGDIRLAGPDFDVSSGGVITAGGQVVGEIRLVRFADPGTLRFVGEGLYTGAAQPEPAVGAVILQGYLEQANVDFTVEMVNMIAALRAYEAGQKMILVQDRLFEKTVGQVGAVRGV